MRKVYLLVVGWILAGIAFGAGVDYDPDPPGLYKLPSFINSPLADEIAPIWTWDESTMYFTRIKDPNFNKTLIYNDQDLYTELPYVEYAAFVANLFKDLGDAVQRDDIFKSPFNQDIFMVESRDGIIQELVHPPHPLNNALPNSVCAIMPDQKTLILMNQFYHNGSMYKGFSTSTRIGKEDFSFPKPLYIYDFKEMAGTDANLTLSKNGEVMIVAFDAKSNQDTDLYVSFRVNNQIYSTPILLEGINSEYREFSPSLSENGKFLFFSSNRGNYPFRSNIYVSQRLDNSYTRWSTPQKLMAPINSEYNEGHPFIIGKKLYFASDRDGSWDIFYFDFNDITREKDSPSVAENTRGVPVTKRNLPLSAEPPVSEKPGIHSVRIKVVDSETKEPLRAMVLKMEDEKPDVRFEVDEKGFVMRFDEKNVITFYPELRNYISKPRSYDIAAMLQDAETVPELLIPVDAIKVDRTISMDPIFFKRGTDRILAVSFGEIKRLAEVLKQHPDVHILIKGHTDNFGDMPALVALSYKRAQAVKKFLLAHDIHGDRIDIKGIGPKEPITDNSTEALKAKNRRVEIIITQTKS